MVQVHKLLRLDGVMEATGLCRSAIYQKIKDGHFPRPVPISARSRGWLESEIVAWQRARIDERETAQRQAAR